MTDILSRPGIRIDTALIQLRAHSYSVASVGSVRIEEDRGAEKAIYVAGIVAVLIAIGFLLNSDALASKIIGVAIAALGVALVYGGYRFGPIYQTMIRTTAGEQVAFQTRDVALAGEIKSAIETAIRLR